MKLIIALLMIGGLLGGTFAAYSYRSAVTGRFTTKSYANSNKSTTIKQKFR